MTQYERMINGLIYDTCDAEIMKMQSTFKDKLWEFNQLKPSESDKKEAYMKEIFAECGKYCYIELPFRASWGKYIGLLLLPLYRSGIRRKNVHQAARGLCTESGRA